ncbi:MAG: hypothetical protein U9N52_11160, partial [Campylobacterota bacterium]|nr:hypothetical protein [Campylobacterota bacterium]
MATTKSVSAIALSGLTAALLAFSGCGGGSSSDGGNSSSSVSSSSSESSSSSSEASTETLRGDITSDKTLTSDTTWILAGNKIKVKDGATLTIEPGTKIYGESKAYLIVTKGSKLVANGTAAQPIVFDSEAVLNGDAPKAGQWGGVTLLGGAQANEANLFYEVDESDADFAYGSTGTEGNTENSGSLK